MTHDEIRARLGHSLTVSGDVAGVRLLEEYVSQQEAAEREHEELVGGMRLQAEHAAGVIDEGIAKLQEAEKRAATAEQEVERLRADAAKKPARKGVISHE